MLMMNSSTAAAVARISGGTRPWVIENTGPRQKLVSMGGSIM